MENNMNMNELMKMLSKMDKKDLEKGLAQVSQLLNSDTPNSIIDKLNNNKNN